MSRKQWGHGYWAGYEDAEKKQRDKLYVVGSMGPIDFWDGAVWHERPSFFVGTGNDCLWQEVLDNMPEEPREYKVYETLIPVPYYLAMIPIYLCKADNNGTVYVLSRYNFDLGDLGWYSYNGKV